MNSESVPTPDNFAIWYEYHARRESGTDAHDRRLNFKQARIFDGPATGGIAHQLLFQTPRNRRVLRLTSLNVMAAAQQVLDLLDAEKGKAIDSQNIGGAAGAQDPSDQSFARLTRVFWRT